MARVPDELAMALALSSAQHGGREPMDLLTKLMLRVNPRLADLVERNAELTAEVARRRETEAALQRAYAELEAQAAERRVEAARAAEQLHQEVQDRRRTEQSLRYSETLLRRLHEDLEDHIAERTSELTKTIAELEAFSYSISHDLRAPLRAINGFAAILREEHAERLDSDGDELLMKIETNAAKMAQLIDGLLDFSRLARAESVSTEVDMGALARSVADELAGEASVRKVEILIGSLPRVVGDEAMLRQVWANLISNAIKFSAPRPAPRIEVTGEQADGEAVFHVRDNGVGFDMDYAGKLFGVFNRLHRADEFPGVGVGLALTRRIVARHGGRVWAESASGEGAVFHFALPAAAARRSA
jgi:light-regulated signal transduction histidine kinase (bacteriophytochrome)